MQVPVGPNPTRSAPEGRLGPSRLVDLATAGQFDLSHPVLRFPAL